MKNDLKSESLNVLKKLVTAVKKGSRELTEFIQDAQGSQSFEREIDEAQQRLSCAIDELSQIMIKQKQAVNCLEIINNKIKADEALVRDAMAADDEASALSFAAKVVEHEKDLVAQHVIVESYAKHIKQLKLHMEASERALKDYKRQLSIVKTTENIQKATVAIKENYATEDKDFLTAKQTLARIKDKQDQQMMDDTAVEPVVAEERKQLNNQQANGAVQDVLERLKKKQQ